MDDFRRSIYLRAGVAAGALFLAASGIVFFIYHIDAAVQTIQSARQELETRQTALRSLLALRNEAAAAKTSMPRLSEKLPKRDDIFLFSKYAEQLARARGVDFGLTFGAEAAAPGGLSSVNFTISTAGPADKITQFLKDLEQGSYIVHIMEIDMSPANTRINGMVYYR